MSSTSYPLRIWVALCGLILILAGVGWLPAGEAEVTLPPPADKKVDYTREIGPIFKQSCQSCHGQEKQMGGLRLDNREGALAGGYSGPVIVPGQSAESRLIHLVAGLKQKKEDLLMPMVGEKLTPEQVGLLRAWIDQGAEWSEQQVPGSVAAQAQPRRPQSKHWAFNPPQRPSLPQTRNRSWVTNPVDAFVLARLESEGIEPSPQADRTTLIRRLSLDLIGLPPTPEELDDFLADTRADAYERLVDRLLASPHYGEKWARQWLDLAHYGDSDGYENDGVRPHAWRWRHWVIEAFNRNMPFDQLTMEQVAGDLLPHGTVEQRVATGFFRNTLTNREGGMPLEQRRNEQVVDRTNTLSTVWLGLTLGCSQCHDHKYDPLTQKDYYQLYAFFDKAYEVNVEAPLRGEMGPYLLLKTTYDQKREQLLDEYNVAEIYAEWEKKILEAGDNLDKAKLEWKVAWDHVGHQPDDGADGWQDAIRIPAAQRSRKLQDGLVDHMIKWYGIVVSGERFKEVRFKELRAKLENLKEEYPQLSEAQTLAENPHPPKTHLLIRGDWQSPGIEVEPDTPAVLPPLGVREGEPKRLSLGRWLVSRANPLTARVTVNRMWQEFFGRGIVATSEDFGTRGEMPTHRELLDWLAVEFMDSGWNLKKMHKLIVSSATYRQSSNMREELNQRDPDNRLLARQSRFRLSAELIRDVTLAASGLLNPVLGGKSVRPPVPSSLMELGFGMNDWIQWKESARADRYRRGLYVLYQRTLPYPQLVTFDAPDSLGACSRRVRSTTPLQALNLLNDPVFFEAARALAVRVLREEAGDLSDRIDYAFRLCLARKPRPSEKDYLIDFYHRQREIVARESNSVERLFPTRGVEGVDPAEAATWVGLSSVLLNLDEFITRG